MVLFEEIYGYLMAESSRSGIRKWFEILGWPLFSIKITVVHVVGAGKLGCC